MPHWRIAAVCLAVALPHAGFAQAAGYTSVELTIPLGTQQAPVRRTLTVRADGRVMVEDRVGSDGVAQRGWMFRLPPDELRTIHERLDAVQEVMTGEGITGLRIVRSEDGDVQARTGVMSDTAGRALASQLEALTRRTPGKASSELPFRLDLRVREPVRAEPHLVSSRIVVDQDGVFTLTREREHFAENDSASTWVGRRILRREPYETVQGKLTRDQLDALREALAKVKFSGHLPAGQGPIFNLSQFDPRHSRWAAGRLEQHPDVQALVTQLLAPGALVPAAEPVEGITSRLGRRG